MPSPALRGYGNPMRDELEPRPDDEQALGGGNATAGVVRVGDTVRKPWTPSAAGVLDFMAHVRAQGVDLPEPRGRDAQGRMVTEFVPGPIALDGPPLTRGELGRAGAMIRAIHDASESFRPAAPLPAGILPVEGADLICHNDLTPWNLVVGERWVFIDWDGAGPSTRLWDLAYSAQAFTLNDATADPAAAAADLAALVDGYGADAALRDALPAAMARRTRAMLDLLESSHRAGREPWGSMFVSGHGEHWRRAAEHVARHQELWARALTP
ncbi:aminoglycoside phosphotransferase family protein [Brachybacterium phenoliresistens]